MRKPYYTEPYPNVVAEYWLHDYEAVELGFIETKQTMTTRNVSILLALVLVVVFTIVGIWFGTPEPTQEQTFTSVLRRFGTDSKTRAILAFILIDVVTGVMAALRTQEFNGQRLAAFYASNVVPYILGYLLVWILVLLGLDTVIPQTLQTTLASFGFAMIVTTLTHSILNNLQRMTQTQASNT